MTDLSNGDTMPRHPAAPDSSCRNCRAASLCMPARIGSRHAQDQLDIRRIKIPRGAAVFHSEEPAGDSFYAVHYGSIKCSVPAGTEHQRIVAFLMSGDLLGLDAIAFKRHHNTAIALDDSEVCAIRCADLRARPLLLHQLLSKEIAHEQGGTQLLRNSSAEQRLAAFLLDLSRRFHQRGYSPRRFRLPMTRQEVASFLAFSAECLSRELARFKEAGLLEVDERDLTLRDIDRLRRLAGGDAGSANGAAETAAPPCHALSGPLCAPDSGSAADHPAGAKPTDCAAIIS